MTINALNFLGRSLPVFVVAALLMPIDADAQRFKPGTDTIAEIAVANGGFTTLVQALSCTGLVGAVADPDARLTVFAPSDAAFAAAGLNAGNICGAFDTATLSNILLYHVTDGRRASPSVINGRNKKIKMLNGGRIFPAGRGTLGLSATGSAGSIAAADILASNGIIHVIDFVLLP